MRKVLRIRRRLHKLGLPRFEFETSDLDARTFARCVTVVDKLIADAQVDVLRAVQEGRVSLPELVDLDRRGQLAGASILTNAVLARPLWKEWERFEQAGSRSPKSTLRYATTRRMLQRRAPEWFTPDMTILQLRAVPWAELAARWRKDRSGSDWNHVRRGVSHFLTVTLGDKFHPFRREIVARIPLQRERVRVPDLTPSVFWSIVSRIREDVRPAFVTLVSTGLRVGEYLRLQETDLRPLTRRLVVGTEGKTGARVVPVAEELWPWIAAGVPSPLGYRRLWQHWHDAVKAEGAGNITIHDLRHSAAQWAHDAGVPLAMVKSLLGHSTIAMTERYARTGDAGTAANAVARALRPRKTNASIEAFNLPSIAGKSPIGEPETGSGGGISGGWALQGSNLRPSDYENVDNERPTALSPDKSRRSG